MSRRILSKSKIYGKPFIIKIDTTKISSGSTGASSFKIPLINFGTTNIKVEWGDGTYEYIRSWNQSSLLKNYATGGVYTIRIYGHIYNWVFQTETDRLKLLEVNQWGEFKSNHNNCFDQCSNLTIIANDFEWFNNNLINGSYYFQNCRIAELPTTASFDNLEVADFMFYKNRLKSLPPSMTLNKLVNGSSMLRDNLIESLPPLMTLSNLKNGSSMLRNNKLVVLPDNLIFQNLELASAVLMDNMMTDLPIGMTLSLMTSGLLCLGGNKINTIRYSQLLIDLNNLNYNNNITFGGGLSQYNSTAVSARNALIARGWTITDGGLI